MTLISNLGLQPIRTSYWFKPGPTDKFDWSAQFDGDEEFGPIGYGPTERDAIIDLLEQSEDALLDQLPEHIQFPETSWQSLGQR